MECNIFGGDVIFRCNDDFGCWLSSMHSARDAMMISDLSAAKNEITGTSTRWNMFRAISDMNVGMPNSCEFLFEPAQLAHS